MKIFITGDRSMDPLSSVSAVMVSLAKADEDGVVLDDADVFTDSYETGVSRAVRYLLVQAQTVDPNLTDEGYVDMDELYTRVSEDVDKVYFVHSDPLGSRIGAALVKNVSPDKLVIV